MATTFSKKHYPAHLLNSRASNCEQIVLISSPNSQFRSN